MHFIVNLTRKFEEFVMMKKNDQNIQDLGPILLKSVNILSWYSDKGKVESDFDCFIVRQFYQLLALLLLFKLYCSFMTIMLLGYFHRKISCRMRSVGVLFSAFFDNSK